MKPARDKLHQSGFSMVEVLVTLVILLVGLLGLAGLMVQSQRSEVESYQRVQALVLLRDMAGRLNANRNVAPCYAFTNNIAGTPFVGTPGAGLLATPPALPATLTNCTITLGGQAPNVPTAAQLTQWQTDITAWNGLLQGNVETTAPGGTSVGAMTGARGCISYNNAPQSPTNPGGELPELIPLTGLPSGPTTLNPTGYISGTGVYTIAIAWQGAGDTFAVNNANSPAMNCGQGLYLNAQNIADEAQRRVVSLTLRVANLY